MKALITALVIVGLAGSVSMAADAENSQSATVDHSKNPITGTHKTVKKSKKKVKDAAGHEAEATTTETTKVGTDGSVDQKTETSKEASQPGH